MTRLVNVDDVIKVCDKHTQDDGTLDNDISCILEEVPTAAELDKTLEVQKFADFLIEHITNKCDMEFDRLTEFNIIRMIVDCESSYRMGGD